jgi:phospholipid transport system transporter-binding protein
MSTCVRECPELKQQLLMLVDCADEVRIDVTDVELIDTAALQLLFAFSRERIANGLSTIWQGDSPTFRNAATTVALQVGDFTGPSTNGAPT